jgi:hypothetical protein
MRAECKQNKPCEKPMPRSMGILPLPRLGFWHGQDARDTHGRDAQATGKAALGMCPFLFALTLWLAAGTAFCAQPAAQRPLPETAVFDRVDGRLLRVDANEGPQTPSFVFGSPDTWLFELTVEVKTPDYRLPAGTRFELLPSPTLGRLIADVNERHTPHYRLSARVTQFRGRNFLLPVYYLPLSKFKDDQGPQVGDPNQEPKIEPPAWADPNLTIPPEVLERLRQQRPLPGPRRRTEPQTTPTPDPPLRMLVNRVGRIESCQPADPSGQLPTGNRQPATENCWVFVPDALGWNVSDVRYELLPSSALEQALHLQRQALEPVRFNIAGLVTEFQCREYLLLQRVTIVYNYGNFGR